MNYLTCLLLLSLLSFVWAAEQAATVDNSYIVELTRSPTESTFFQHDIRKVRYTYDSDLLQGVSVEFGDSISAKLALAHPDVVNAWPVSHHTRPSGLLENSKEPVKEAFNIQPFSPEQIPLLTQSYSEAYRQLGVNGSNIRIGVIDSGVDYRHPALGGCFGSGCKIEFGYDLVGDAYNGTHETAKEDNDPLDNCPPLAVGATGHGTFVSGLIAATDSHLNWTGTAPAATLGMWRVFGCNSQLSTTDVFLKAMEMAYEADMDIINLSFGQDGGWHEDVISVLADRLVSQGVHVVVASGNIGTSGIMLTAAPATANGVIAVGSTMNSELPGFILTVTSNKKDKDALNIPYRTIVNQPISFNQSLPLQSINNACSEIDSSKYKETITLIQANSKGCSLLTKLRHAKNAGVKIALVYTDSNETVQPDTSTSSAELPVGFINAVSGEAILDFLKKEDDKVQGQFTRSIVALPSPKNTANRITSFSSLGPTNELVLKPELTATGGDMFSTMPLYKGGYGVLSGTSMSAPLVTGAIALFLSALDEKQRKDVDPETVKEALMNFARPLGSPIDKYPQYGDSPIRQGAGLVSVVRAIQGYEQFHVSPSKLSFNDTEHFEETQTLTIHNHGAKDLTFNLVHGPALSVQGYDKNNLSDYTPLEPITFSVQDNSVATISFNKQHIQVSAGDSVDIQLSLKPPSYFAPNSHAIYGGYIGIETVDKTLSASVPYIGMVGNMSRLPILDRSSAGVYPFPSIGNYDGTILKENETGKFTALLQPTVLVRLLTGTPLLDLQVIKDGDKDKKYNVIGTIPFDEMSHESRAWLPRNTRSITPSSTVFHAYKWDGQYKSGLGEERYVESGTYRIRVRALHVFGDRENVKDWDEWLSPPLYMDMDGKQEKKKDGDLDNIVIPLPTASTTAAPQEPSNNFANHPSATQFVETTTPPPFANEEQDPTVPSGTEGFTSSVSP
ncbi:peptidase S8/S53 domain-containing protein [Phascolomyces articulosus]|uniref:Peptidase S8/S53 domain-containing protein n=1 Tax=Phascolomyces articulosus TaxID=60185 RepID=A0AAD5PIP8_9FUNG|nr:peptidase S8/S53 domain-containing protein [Phascolomyces articulosus]